MTQSKVLVTFGDPNGIGPEIAIAAAAQLAGEGRVAPILVGDVHVAEKAAQWIGADLSGLDMIDVGALAPGDHAPGHPTPASGSATVRYLEAALDAVETTGAIGVVGCPHSETAINASGRPFSGYPNLLAELRGGGADSVVLMLVGGGLRVAHVTLHEPIRKALDRITPELIAQTIQITDKGLKRLGIEVPRIGVMGFNPHAGEGGLFGDEDDRLVRPAVENALSDGIDVIGPEGADLLLGREDVDAFVALYHDQGHIPVKLLAGREISALSLGSDVLFSSTGHGAAFDIAGQGKASHAAVLRAARIVGGADGV